MTGWRRSPGDWERRRWAVEGCFGAGRSLAQRLVADGEMVLDVPAKLAARVRVDSHGHGRKTNKGDAVSVVMAALDGTGVRLCVPKTSSASCDQAIFVYQSTDSRLFSDAALSQIDRFG